MTNKDLQFFRLFVQVCKTVNSTLSLSEVLKLITENVAQVLAAKACTIFLLDKRRNRLEVSASCGLTGDYLSKGPLNADRSITECLEGKPVQVKDTTKDSRIQYPDEAQREGIASVLSVPIPVKEKVIGVLRVYTAQPRVFDDDEVEFVSGLAEMGGIAIVNAKLYEELQADSQVLLDDTWEWFETMLPAPSG